MLMLLALTAALADDGDRRLDPAIRPTHQAVDLKINPSKKWIKGYTQITLNLEDASNIIRLHAVDLKLKNARVGKQKATIVDDDGIATLTFKRELAAGEQKLEITFKSPVRTGTNGLYRAVDDGDAFIFSQLEATEARTAFPCFDEPSFKQPWTFRVTARDTHQVLHNTKRVKKVPVGSWLRHEFATTRPLPSYLLAFAVGPLKETPLDVAGAKVWSSSRLRSDVTPIVTSVAPQLQELETYFGEPMPYDKMDFVVASNFGWGGMENPGLIVLAPWLAYGDNDDPEMEARLAEVVSHEIAHQWFGNLVTPAWWDDLWLNESFASWRGLESSAAVLPDSVLPYVPINRLHRALRIDADPGARPIRSKVDPDDVFNTVNFIAYAKGQALLRTIERWTGPNRFRKGIQKHLETHRDGVATAQDLFDSLEATSGLPVGEVMLPFIDEPGGPLLRFSRDGSGWTITQEPLLAYGNDEQRDTTWTIPIVMRTPEGRIRTVLAEKQVSTVEKPAEAMEEGASSDEPTDEGVAEPIPDSPQRWMMPALDGVGFYAWTFEDPQDLGRLTMNIDQLNPHEQLGLVGNLGTLHYAGELSPVALLRTLEGILPDLAPAAARRALDELEWQVQPLIEPKQQDAYQERLISMFAPVHKSLGEPSDSEPQTQHLLRRTLAETLMAAGHQETRQAHEAVARSLMKPNEDKDIPTMPHASRFLARWAQAGDRALQEELLSAADTHPELSGRLLTAMVGMDRDDTHAFAMNWLLNHEPKQRFRLLRTALERHDDPTGWLDANRPKLEPALGKGFGRLVQTSAPSCDLENWDRAMAMGPADRPRKDDAPLTRRQRLRNDVSACTKRREADGKALADALFDRSELTPR